MIIIEYHRFVLEPDSKIEIKIGGLDIEKVHYHEEFDHTDIMQDDATDYIKIKQSVKGWTKNHYGYVLIYIPNSTESSKVIKKKFCNRFKFWNDMLIMGVLVEKH